MSDLPCITCVSGVRGMPCIIDVACHPRDEAENYQPITFPEFNADIIKQDDTLGSYVCDKDIAEDTQVNTDVPSGTFLDDTSDIDLTSAEKRVLLSMVYSEPKQTSDGSTASYYQLPAGATELQHLISYRDMNAQIGEIFRACYRYGIASHSDKLRDAKKIRFYAEAEIARLEKQV